MTGVGRPRLLYVDVKWPRPELDAASLRAIQLIEALGTLGFAVDVAVIDSIDGAIEPPASLVGARPIASIGVDAILEAAGRAEPPYAVAVLAWTRTAELLMEPLHRRSPGTAIVFDTVDVNHVREFRHARVSGNANLLRRAMAMKAAEVRAVRAADRTLAVTPEDARTLEAACPGRRVDVVTLAAIDRAGAVPGPAGRHGMLFLGNVHAWHNVDAILHLVDDILPEVLRRRPGLGLTLAGAGHADPIAAIDHPAVRQLGRVGPLEPVFDEARMFVCPLRFGSGIKGKLQAALALGLPIVTSPIGAEGMDLVDGESCLIAETPAAFADAVVRLDLDDALWSRLSAAGREVARSAYGPAVVARQVAEVFGGYLRASIDVTRRRVPGADGLALGREGAA